MKFGIAYYVPKKHCQINEKMSIPRRNLNKPTDALVNLMNQLNNLTDDVKENELNLPN